MYCITQGSQGSECKLLPMLHAFVRKDFANVHGPLCNSWTTQYRNYEMWICEALPNRPIGGQLRLKEKELGEVEGETERERERERVKRERQRGS